MTQGNIVYYPVIAKAHDTLCDISTVPVKIALYEAG